LEELGDIEGFGLLLFIHLDEVDIDFFGQFVFALAINSGDRGEGFPHELICWF
jgi:hypothetical protein